MTESILTSARDLLADVARHGNALWIKQMETTEEPTAPVRNMRLLAVIYAMGLAHALAALTDVDPARADEVAAEICDAWEDGGGVGEWLWEHGVKAGVLTDDGRVVGRDGTAESREVTVRTQP